MPKKRNFAAHMLLLLLLGIVHPAFAESVGDLSAIRAEIEALKTDYAARVAGLEFAEVVGVQHRAAHGSGEGEPDGRENE